MGKNIPIEFEGTRLTESDRQQIQSMNFSNLLVQDLKFLVGIIIRVRGGDFVYQEKFGSACRNFVTGHLGKKVPACIIGSAFYLLGIDYRECGESGNLTTSAYSLSKTRPDIGFSEGFMKFGLAIQSMQDSRVPYGAVEIAFDSFGRIFGMYTKQYTQPYKVIG